MSVRRGRGAAVLLAVLWCVPSPLRADPGQHRDDPAMAAPAPARTMATRAPVVAKSVPSRSVPAKSVPLRVEDRPGFGRLVVGFAHPNTFITSRSGDQVTLRFATPVAIAGSPRLPRNVTAVTGGDGQLQLTLVPGHELRLGNAGTALVIDVLDAPQARPPLAAARDADHRRGEMQAAVSARAALADAPAATSTATMPVAPTVPVTGVPLPAPVTTASEAEPADEPGAPEAMLASPFARPDPSGPDSSGPVSLAVARVTGEPAMLVPFEAGVGLALFRRGGEAVAVFDASRPLDVAALREDAVFVHPEVQVLAAATVLRFTLAKELELHAVRDDAGWRLSAAPAPAPAAIAIRESEGRLLFTAAATGKVVVVPDAATGGTMLVGTQAQPGQGFVVARRSPDFSLLPTWQGVAVAPVSDRLELRAVPPGFVLAATAGGALALSGDSPGRGALGRAAQERAAALTRRFDLPDQPREALIRRLQAAIADAAAAPLLSRLRPRVAAAGAMITLGLAAEAQAVLRLAAEDDPHAAADPEAVGLAGVAALLAGRPAEAAGILDPALGDSDEVRFWRGVRTAMIQPGAPAAAAQLAVTAPLLPAYPEGIRAHLLPPVAETLLQGGQAEAAAALLEGRDDDASLALARAMLAEARGTPEQAIAAYDAVGASPDRRQSIAAGLRGTELRLSRGALSPREAAAAETRLLYGWRGDEQERALRVRIAALLAQGGDWRGSFAMLRESEALFGGTQSGGADGRFGAARRAQLAHLLEDAATDRLAPLELVRLVEENPDLLPEGAPGEAMAARLADRLQTLELPRRADPVLDRLARTAAMPAARGAFGARLAALRLAGGDASGAMTALAASAGDGFSAALTQQRGVLAAQATARAGRQAEALSQLGTLNGNDAALARAALLEQSKDFAGAASALRDYVGAAVPVEGKLTAAQEQAVLRLAGDTVQSGDEAGLAELRARFAGRLASKPAADVLASLTAAPVRGLADLARSAKEVSDVKALPAAVQAASKN